MKSRSQHRCSITTNSKELIDEGVEVGTLKEPEKRRLSRAHEENNDEKTTEEKTKDLVETVVERFLEEQESAHEENILKIEIVENPPSTHEEDQELKYLMIAELQIGKETSKNQAVSIRMIKLEEKQDKTKGEEKPKTRKEIEVKDLPESYESYTEDEERAPPKEGTSAALTPKESRKIPVVKSKMLLKVLMRDLTKKMKRKR